MIRKAHSDTDVNSIHEIGLSLFDKPYSLMQIFQEFSLTYSLTLVSFHQNIITGYLIGRTLSDEAEILQVGVKKEFQKQGHGFDLVQQFCTIAKNKKCHRVFLEVSMQNPSAIALYQRCDFQKQYIRKQYYHSGDDALIMEKIL